MSDLAADLAAERRAAARLLLRCPLVTATSHPEEFPLVRRHADELAKQFEQVLGYRLVVEPGFARLLKAGLGHGGGRRLERASGTPFTPRTYAYLALALAVLVTAPEQLLLSEVVTRVRAAAAEARVDLGEPNRAVERRALVAALRRLMAWRVLAEDEGSVEAYAGDGAAEVLLTVDREIARRLVSGPIGRASSPGELIDLAAASEHAGPRHTVRRRLVETPVVYVAGLDERERDWLRRNQRREQRIFEEFLGLDAEIRAEGVALVDPQGELSDLEFPGTGTVAWAALLLVGELARRWRDAWVTVEVVDLVLAELVERHRRAWAAQYVESPETLRHAVLELLERMSLAEHGEDGWRLSPAAARYAPEVRDR
ncbi:TIGR02678 family protein [Actinomadura hibisca]|uniref:TIGR02678 family protein n=1 Tax=Actinomadura hibisca TaxID=68565 RepID=UPI000830F253|nr:TIGR02678 family protein [Actinomadura hibisca]